MDNLTHTLVGAVLAESGLRKRTALATATLLIGSNLPDVDGVLYWLGRNDLAYGFRRGWTHGILAIAVWPFVLTGLVLAWDRLVRRRRPGAAPVRVQQVFWLSALAIATHPFLDYLNTYGTRFLMPFSNVWSYADTLFIADPWIWIALGAGYVVASRRRRGGAPHPERAAVRALVVVGVYVAAMGASGVAARGVARRAIETPGVRVRAMMAGPAPLTPFRRQVVADVGEGYVLGTVDWLRRPAFTAAPDAVPKNAALPEVAAAGRTDAGASFLRWARFPFFRVRHLDVGTVVEMIDARYTLRPPDRFGALSVLLPAR